MLSISFREFWMRYFKVNLDIEKKHIRNVIEMLFIYFNKLLL